MTSDVLKMAAYAAWGAVIGLASWRLVRARGSEPGLSDRVPRWYTLVVVAATISLAIALGAAGLLERR